MKHTLIFSILLAMAAAARADLVMQQQSSTSNTTYTITLKLHGDKMRMDQNDGQGHEFSVIVDMATHDSMTLMPKEKQFLKHAGAQSRSATKTLPPQAVATGTAEKVAGYNTEVYTWTGTNGLAETLWVAKDFPNYEAIRADLIKIDEFKNTGLHAAAQPDVSLLPGMVVKTETTLKGRSKGRQVTINLVSAKSEPVDAALFELPADYKEWAPPKTAPRPSLPKSLSPRPRSCSPRCPSRARHPSNNHPLGGN